MSGVENEERESVEHILLCPFGKDDGGPKHSEDTFSVRRYSGQADSV